MARPERAETKRAGGTKAPRKRAEAKSETTELGRKLVASLRELAEHAETGRPMEERFRVTSVKIDLDPSEYDGARVAAVRARFKASQPLFARFLGVSAAAIRHWEQGLRPIPNYARRFLDELQARPEMWTDRVEFKTKGPTK